MSEVDLGEAFAIVCRQTSLLQIKVRVLESAAAPMLRRRPVGEANPLDINALGQALEVIDREVKRLQVERDTALAAARLLRQREQRLAAAAQTLEARQLAELAAARERVEVELATGRNELAERAATLAQAEQRLARQGDQLAAAEQTLATVEAERAALESERSAHRERLAGQAGAEDHVADAGDMSAADSQTTFAAAQGHLLFVPRGGGYSLVERAGSAPQAGEILEYPEPGQVFIVSKLGSSPLPLDRRACAYLQLR